MKRRFLVGMGLAGAALLSIPAAVFAQGAPPDPPATYYGTVTGASVGQQVIAIVFNGGTGTACGYGTIQQESGSSVYVVDVATQSQTPGCGATGRSVRFYIAGTGSTAGRFATESASWSGAGPKQQNINMTGAQLPTKRFAPFVASDGVY
ncbi:MAG: hypothetical protein IT303_09545 [Dehalococcoidia bacterium]|nr:hypothetical protein [Dehalococcoidia bacterium]